MDKQFQVYVLGFLLLLILTYFILSLWSNKQKFRKRFEERSSLSKEEIFAAYYSDSDISRQIVYEVLENVSNSFFVPISKIRPTDIFNIDYENKGWEYDFRLDEFAYIEDRMKQAEIETAPELHTVDDLVRYVAYLEKEIELKRR